MEFGEMKRNTLNWSNFCILLISRGFVSVSWAFLLFFILLPSWWIKMYIKKKTQLTTNMCINYLSINTLTQQRCADADASPDEAARFLCKAAWNSRYESLQYKIPRQPKFPGTEMRQSRFDKIATGTEKRTDIRYLKKRHRYRHRYLDFGIPEDIEYRQLINENSVCFGFYSSVKFLVSDSPDIPVLWGKVVYKPGVEEVEDLIGVVVTPVTPETGLRTVTKHIRTKQITVIESANLNTT